MPRRLIRLLPDGRHAWYEAGREVGGLPPPGEAALTFLAPGEDVLLLDIARPPGSEHQWRHALPFAIEDQVIAPIETQHVAWAIADDPSRLRVAVVARTTLDAWLAPLRAAGLEPDVVLPEALALPWQRGTTSMLVEHGRVVWRLDACRALCGDADELARIHDATGPLATTVFRVGDAPLPAIAGTHRDVASAAQVFAATDTPALNLLQGDYAPRGRVGDARRAWRWAAAFALAALLLPVVQAGIERQRLATRLAAQETEMAQLARRLAPNAVATGDAANDLRARLGVGADQGTLSLLARAAPALAANGLRVESLDLRDAQVELVVQAGDLASLDALRERLVQAGLAAELTGSTPGTQGVQGRLRLGGPR